MEERVIFESLIQNYWTHTRASSRIYVHIIILKLQAAGSREGAVQQGLEFGIYSLKPEQNQQNDNEEKAKQNSTPSFPF